MKTRIICFAVVLIMLVSVCIATTASKPRKTPMPIAQTTLFYAEASRYLFIPEVAEHYDTIRKMAHWNYDYATLFYCWYFKKYPEKIIYDKYAGDLVGQEFLMPTMPDAFPESEIEKRDDGYFGTYLEAFNASAGCWYSWQYFDADGKLHINSHDRNDFLKECNVHKISMDYTAEECLFLAYVHYVIYIDRGAMRENVEQSIKNNGTNQWLERDLFMLDALDAYVPSDEMWKRFDVSYSELVALGNTMYDICSKYDIVSDTFDPTLYIGVDFKLSDYVIGTLAREFLNYKSGNTLTLKFEDKDKNVARDVSNFLKSSYVGNSKEVVEYFLRNNLWTGDFYKIEDVADALAKGDDYSNTKDRSILAPTATPTPKPTPTVAPTKAPTTAPTKTPTAVPTPTGTVKATPTSEITPAVTDTPTPTAEITPVEEPSPTEEPVITDIPVTTEPSPTEAPTEVEVTEIPTPEPTATEVPAEISPSSELSDISDEPDGTEGAVSTSTAMPDPTKAPAADSARTEPAAEDKESTPLTPWIVGGAAVLVVAAVGVVIGVKIRKKQ